MLHQSVLSPSTPLNPLVAPFNVIRGNESFVIREARRDEVEAIAWAAAKAFINDAMVYYISGTTQPMSVTEKANLGALHDFYYFLFKTCMIGKGRTVIAIPLKESSSATTIIAAAACWYPPRKRITPFNALRGGLLRCIMNWGWSSFKRMSKEYSVITHSVFEQAFASKAMEIQTSDPVKRVSPDKTLSESDSWYLQVMFSAKQFEGQGLMSTLMREGFAYMHNVTPGIPVTLDATSPRARDRYMHLGYELMEPQTLIGVGKVSSVGIAPSKKNHLDRNELTGVPYWCMVNWTPMK